MTRTVVPSPIVHELLNKNNYEEWSLQVKTYLLAEDLWDVVEATTEPPEQEDDEVEFKAWRKSNAKALHSIQISCGVDTFSFIMGASTAKVAWHILAEKLKPAEASQATGIEEISNDDTNNNPTTVDAKLEEWLAIESEEISDDDTNNNPTTVDAKLEEGSAIESGHEENHVSQNIMDYVKRGDWDAAKKLLEQHPDAVTARIRKGGTILHWAVFCKKVDIAKELVHLMRPEDLETQDYVGLTALHRVIHKIPESVELAKCMVEKNKKLLGIVFPPKKTIPLLAGKITPLIQAHNLSHEGGEKMAQYLYNVTPHETLNDSQCAMLIIQGFLLKRFGKQVKPLPPIQEPSHTQLKESAKRDDDVYMNDPADMLEMSARRASCSGISLIRRLVVKTFGKLLDTLHDGFRGLVVKAFAFGKLLGTLHYGFRGLVVKAFGFNRIYQMKLAHFRILEFLPHMCKVTENKDVKELQGLEKAMFLAIKKGHVEYITHLCRANYKLCSITNEKGRNIFQFAAECRQHKVFSLLYGLDNQRTQEWFIRWKDKSSNNMLHVVGTISSAAQINLIQGAALQMQRELQWFKEVERLAEPVVHEVMNETDEMTPRELFTKGHEDLVKEGEKAMKDTATSCTVVGALIVTIMFAAAFTFPGGTNQDTGFPMFLSKWAFITFIVSDAISLSSSTTSVVIFLGVLTSRYAEDDFLKSLPRKMILGLITLFLSITAMMTAFSSALSIMLHGKSSIAIVLTLLSSVPVASFIWMQFRLLRELVISTYGAGVFDRKIKNWPFEDPKYSAWC